MVPILELSSLPLARDKLKMAPVPQLEAGRMWFGSVNELISLVEAGVYSRLVNT